MKNKLAADHLAVIDFGLLETDVPAINLGARGLIALEAVLRGSNIDLHSGGYGGVAYNPNRAAAEWIANAGIKTAGSRFPIFTTMSPICRKKKNALFTARTRNG